MIDGGSCSYWSCVAHGIGCIVLCKFIYDVFEWVQKCFLRPCKDLKKEYGEWACITGATDGIGKAIALELSSKHNMKNGPKKAQNWQK